MLKHLCAALAVSGLAVSQVHAHVVLADPQAVPGVTYAALFRIGHGCGESPTIAMRVEIPPTVTAVSGEPEQGWTLDVERNGDRIVAVTWAGGVLPNPVRGHFGILLKLPETPGNLYFPTVQTCQAGENRWTTIPAEGQSWHDTPQPAPVLTIVPRDAVSSPASEPPSAPEHEHHHH